MRAPGSIARRIGPHVHRLQPRSLRGRLAVAATILSLAAAATTFGLSYVAAMRQVEALALSHASTHLRSLQAFVELEKREVDLAARELADSSAMRSGARGEGRLSPEVAMGLAAADQDGVVVASDTEGTILYSRGPAGPTRELRSFVASAAPEPLNGLAWLPSGATVLAVRPIRDTTEARTLGWVAVARPLGSDLATRFLPLSDDVSIALRPPDAAAVPDGGTVAGFANVAVGLGREHSTVRTILPGVAGPAAQVELRIGDSSLRSAMRAARRVALFSGALDGVLGVIFGLGLAQAFAGPIARMRDHVKREGARALEGLPTVPLVHRPETSSDFLELTADFDALLAALGRHQVAVRAASEQAQAAEASLRSVLEDSPEAKVLVEDGRVALVNKAAERIMDVPAASLLGMRDYEVIEAIPSHTEDGERVTPELLATAAVRPLVMRFDHADGTTVWVENKVVPDETDPTRYLVTARDITEERRIEELREELFSLVSHDLRAPLTVIQGYLDILDRPLTPEARVRAMESARHNAAKMADMLEDLLDATGAEQVLAPKVLEPVDLGELAEEVASSLAPTAPDRQLEVVREAPAVALGEERRLRQALINLVTNALKYTPAGCRVCVRVECAGEHGLLVVEDDGPGVPPESREAIFERFGRAASAKGKPGLGLGLYIVRLITESHGGRARVEAASSGGARFVLELPLAQACEDAETA